LFDKYNKEEQNSFLIFQNLHERNRLDSWALVVAIFTIAGIPSTIGFIAKYQLFAAVLPFTTWGILFALVGSAISIAYYFKPFRVVYKSIPKENESEKTITTPFANRVVLLVLIGIIGLFGLLPNTWNILF
jgi:NADH-quinone oxidoreductase subunit N